MTEIAVPTGTTIPTHIAGNSIEVDADSIVKESNRMVSELADRIGLYENTKTNLKNAHALLNNYCDRIRAFLDVLASVEKEVFTAGIESRQKLDFYQSEVTREKNKLADLAKAKATYAAQTDPASALHVVDFTEQISRISTSHAATLEAIHDVSFDLQAQSKLLAYLQDLKSLHKSRLDKYTEIFWNVNDLLDYYERVPAHVNELGLFARYINSFVAEVAEQDASSSTGMNQFDRKFSMGIFDSLYTWESSRALSYVAGKNPVPAFFNGVNASDVNQGNTGDCWLLATIIAVAHSDPKFIENMITQRADGSFDVLLYDGDGRRQSIHVTYDDIFGFDTDKKKMHSDTVMEMWPSVLEAALSIAPNSLNIGFSAPLVELPGGFEIPLPRYEGRPEDITDISGGGIGYTMESAFYTITGNPSESSSGDVYQFIKDNPGKPMSIGTSFTNAIGLSSGPKPRGMIDHHAYAVIGLDASGNVILQNPWGKNSFGEDYRFTVTPDQLENWFKDELTVGDMGS